MARRDTDEVFALRVMLSFWGLLPWMISFGITASTNVLGHVCQHVGVVSYSCRLLMILPLGILILASTVVPLEFHGGHGSSFLLVAMTHPSLVSRLL